MKQAIPIVIFILISGCTATQKPSLEFRELLQKSTAGDFPIFKSGGYTDSAYIMGEEEKERNPMFLAYKEVRVLRSPWLFFPNGYVVFRETNIWDNPTPNPLPKLLYKKHSAFNWGVYDRRGDSLIAIMYIHFLYGRGFKTATSYQVSFSGKIDGDGSISGWRMLPPYPRASLLNMANQRLFNFLAESRTLHFESTNVTKNVNPELAWIRRLQ